MADDRGCPLKSVGLALVTGGLLGAALGLLLAPRSGRDTREQLRGYARRAEENVHELADNATRILDQAVDKGHEFIKDKQEILSDAVDAGRVAMHRERDRLSCEEKKRGGSRESQMRGNRTNARTIKEKRHEYHYDHRAGSDRSALMPGH